MPWARRSFTPWRRPALTRDLGPGNRHTHQMHIAAGRRPPCAAARSSAVRARAPRQREPLCAASSPAPCTLAPPPPANAPPLHPAPVARTCAAHAPVRSRPRSRGQLACALARARSHAKTRRAHAQARDDNGGINIDRPLCDNPNLMPRKSPIPMNGPPNRGGRNPCCGRCPWGGRKP